jgi:ABC-type transport system involved in cytochrome bd biosynthesis fused ATPase/permease subunit
MDELPSREVSSIEFENVSFQYEARSAPQNLNLSIHSPGLYFLKGPNGSGKTTVLKIMAGLLRPTTGKVIINQDPLFLQHFIPHFSFLGQDVFLFSGSIKDNVTIHEKVSDPEWENFLEEFELESLINVHSSISFNGKECSGGEKKLIGLARALFQKSHFVLLDEPLASLDQRKRHLILNILKKHSLTRIIFMTGHQSLDENFFTQTFTIKSE